MKNTSGRRCRIPPTPPEVGPHRSTSCPKHFDDFNILRVNLRVCAILNTGVFNIAHPSFMRGEIQREAPNCICMEGSNRIFGSPRQYQQPPQIGEVAAITPSHIRIRWAGSG
jgi:hypothetical protein